MSSDVRRSACDICVFFNNVRYIVHHSTGQNSSIFRALVSDLRASVKDAHSVTYRCLWRNEVRCAKIKNGIDAIDFKTVLLMNIKFSWCCVIKNIKKIIQNVIYTAIKTLGITFSKNFNESSIYESRIFNEFYITIIDFIFASVLVFNYNCSISFFDLLNFYLSFDRFDSFIFFLIFSYEKEVLVNIGSNTFFTNQYWKTNPFSRKQYWIQYLPALPDTRSEIIESAC